jgi:hypothetical protein
MSSISAGTTTGTALVSTGDTTGQLVLKTNGTTTAVTIGTDQVVTLAQPLPAASGGTGLTAFPAPSTSGNVLTSNGTAWTSAVPAAAGKLLQVVSTTKTDTFSSSTTDVFTDITGLSVSITPTSSSSKILVIASVQGINANGLGAMLRFVRNSTAIGIGDASGSRSRVSGGNLNYASQGGSFVGGTTFQFLDSPATTSSTTYKVQFYLSGGTLIINRTADNDNAEYSALTQSTITVMEIAV